MTYEQYWYGDPQMARAYFEADILRQERRNSEMWLMGAYVYDAISRLTPVLHAFAKRGTEPIKYMDAPYELEISRFRQKTEAEKEKEAEREATFAYAYMMQFMEAGKNWGKKKDTAQKKENPDAPPQPTA